MIDKTVTIKCFLRIIFFWGGTTQGFPFISPSREVSWSMDMYDSKGWDIEVIKNQKTFAKKRRNIFF